MRGLSAPVVVLLAVIGAVGCRTSQNTRGPEKAPEGYVSLSVIGTHCRLAYTVEGTGTGVLTGNGHRVVVRDGLAVAFVNGERVQLSGPARVEGMNAQVPRDSEAKIVASLGTAVDLMPEPPRQRDTKVTAPPRNLTVVIDPGHGGKFDGARARNGLEEKTVNLDVARRLRDALKRLGFRVLMTRETDRKVADNYRDDLDARVRLAERNAADLFISIHSNANNNAGIAGFEVYRARAESRPDRQKRMWTAVSTYWKTPPAKSASALYDLNRIRTAAFADEIRTSMRTTGIPDRGVREAGFHVIKWAPCPAVLVEMDYLSNAGGMQRLGNASVRQKIADALASGIARFAAR